MCVCEFGSQRVIAGNRWNCLSGELQQLTSEPITDLIQESIVAWYKWRNHDRAIEYARSMTKGGGNEDNHEVGGGCSYPTLTKTNYSNWALLMKVKLKAHGLWVAVEPGSGDLQDGMMALDVLSSAVPPKMVSVVASQDTAKGMWDTIKVMRVSDDRV
jgi:hypothetical protein